LKSTFNRA